MPRRSSGLLLYRKLAGGGVEVLLGHMGGPFWARRDAGAWSIPKGEPEPGEDPMAAAARELREELGIEAPGPPYLDLGEVRQSSKVVHVWAVEGDVDPAACVSNTVEVEWPPRSGRRIEVPEIDRAAWFSPEAAREKLVKGQAAAVDALVARLAGTP
jgi:predicted NUDIX family NTP pyrophosphohydrolase